MQVAHIGRWDIADKWADHKYAGCSVRWDKYIMVRHEPCAEKDCGTCKTALKRGLENTRPLYTNNNDHYRLPSSGKWELYDVESDPYQEKNIAGNHPELLKRMREFYEKWWMKVENRMKAQNKRG